MIHGKHIEEDDLYVNPDVFGIHKILQLDLQLGRNTACRSRRSPILPEVTSSIHQKDWV